MLGAQTWFVAFAVPTVVIGSFIATRKRLAFQWRDELMDPDGTIYPTLTDTEMRHIRQVSSAEEIQSFQQNSPHMNPKENHYSKSSSATCSSSSSSFPSRATSHSPPVGHSLSVEDNMGWFLTELGDYGNIYGDSCLTEVKHVAKKFGIEYNQRKVHALKKQLALEEHDSEKDLLNIFVDQFAENKVLSDHAEDTRLMKAPWGSGDRLCEEKMPLLLRHLSRQIQQVFPDVGRLRHVYIEYAPFGRFYKEPKSPKVFDGHDFVMIPLRRDHSDSVLTFVPSLRSKFSSLHDVMKYSWTSRDVDIKIPHGAMLRVYGRARYDWGWGIRPGRMWWGSCLQPVGDQRMCVAGGTNHKETSISYSQRLLSAISQCISLSLRKKEGYVSPCLPLQKAGGSDAALLFFHFEGPRAKGKKRSLFFHPESLIFGFPPKLESFEKWEEDRPSEEEVKKTGVVKFLVMNYLTMFRVS